MYKVEAPSRSVTGTATIDAHRPSSNDPWNFKSLVLEFDAASVIAANAARDEAARRGGYGDVPVAESSASTSSSPTEGEKLTIRIA